MGRALPACPYDASASAAGRAATTSGAASTCCCRAGAGCSALEERASPLDARTCCPVARGHCKDERSVISRDVISEELKESNCYQFSGRETACELLIHSYCQVI